MPRYIPEFHHDFLYNAYVVEQKSLDDIALECQCTRPGVWKAMRRFSVPTRSRSEARRLALRHEKFTYHDSEGNIRFTQAVTYDEKFLSTPSCDLSWVTGVLVCSIVSTTNKRYGSERLRLKFRTPDLELIDKTLALMKCNARISETSDGLYELCITQQDILQGIWDSLKTTYCAPCLIRGIFDSYANIHPYLTPLCEIASNDKETIRILRDGLRKQKNVRSEFIPVSENKSKLRFTGKYVAKLAEILYSDSTELNRLNRKYELFKLSAYKYGVEIN